MSNNIKNNSVKIIAGPDGIDDYNINEIYEISDLAINGQKIIYGTRTVGLKSRTNFDKVNSDAGFMGCDFDTIMRNFNIFGLGGNCDDLKPLPSVNMAAQIYKDTGLLCATEIMLPAIQLASIAKSFKFKPFMVWNPAVDQLGWHVRQMAGFAEEYDWVVGIKNGKWIGDEYELAESEDYKGKTSLEVCWDGLVDYSVLAPETVIINRGVDVPRKGEFRNLPIHNIAKRTKLRNASKGVKCYFDPSHSLGPKLRDDIVRYTVEAMKMKVAEDEYLYDGVLIEVGTAKCDTHQHITVKELYQMCEQIGEFRTLVGR
jgi:hypothetical protein